jgi:hypothetical protein
MHLCKILNVSVFAYVGNFLYIIYSKTFFDILFYNTLKRWNK